MFDVVNIVSMFDVVNIVSMFDVVNSVNMFDIIINIIIMQLFIYCYNNSTKVSLAAIPVAFLLNMGGGGYQTFSAQSPRAIAILLKPPSFVFHT